MKPIAYQNIGESDYDIVEQNIQFDKDSLNKIIQSNIKENYYQSLILPGCISSIIFIIWIVKLFKKEEKSGQEYMIDTVTSSDKFFERVDKRIETKTEKISARVNDMQDNMQTLIKNTSVTREEMTEMKTNIKWLVEAIKELKEIQK